MFASGAKNTETALSGSLRILQEEIIWLVLVENEAHFWPVLRHKVSSVEL